MIKIVNVHKSFDDNQKVLKGISLEIIPEVTCGNGTREFTEQCDDGNLVEGDGCDALCRTPIGKIMALYDASAVNGDLVGDGPGESGAGRMSALRNMLDSASTSTGKGISHRTCGSLSAALKRTDGVPRPPDFVTGPAASELAAQIEALRSSLGCEG